MASRGATLTGRPADAKRRRWPSATLVFLGTLLYLRLLPDCFHLFDEAILADTASRMLAGEVLYRDIFSYWHPAAFEFVALSFGILGTTVEALRLPLVLMCAAAAVAVWRLARDHVGGRAAIAVALASVWVCCPWWWMASAHWYATFTTLATMVALRRSMLGGHRRWDLAWTGLLAGLCFTILQPVGLTVIPAVAGAAFLDALAVGSLRRAFGSLAVVLVAALVPPGIEAARFLAQGALADLVRDAWLWNLRQFRPNLSAGYGQIGFGVARSFPLAVVRAFLMTVPPFVLLIGLARTSFAYARGRASATDRSLGAAAVPAAALWVSHAYYPDLIHLCFAAPAAFPVLAACLGSLRPQRLQRLLGASFFVCALGIGLYAAWLLRADCGDPVDTVCGPVRVSKSARAHLAAALGYLREHAERGTPVFVYPYAPGYNFLSGHPNPTRFEALFPSIDRLNTPAEFEEAARVIDARQVRFVVLSPLFGETDLRRHDTALERLLRGSYKGVPGSPLILERSVP